MLKFFKMPNNIDKRIQYSIYFLLVFGLLMITSATQGMEAASISNLITTILKQIIFTFIGYMGMVFVCRFFSFYLVNRYINTIVLATCGALAITLLFGSTDGAYAWIRMSLAGIEVTIQPSEFSKLIIIVLSAYYFGDIKANNRQEFIERYKKPVIIMLGMVLFVFLVQNDFGSALIMGVILVSCFMSAKHRVLYYYQKIMYLVIGVGIIGAIFILSPLGTAMIEGLGSTNYQLQRFLSAADPFKYQYEGGYQLIQGLMSIASGGMFGVGFGNSLLKYGAFPATNTDFILAVIIEELGFVLGFLPIIIAYLFIVSTLIHYAIKIPDNRSKIILIGITTYLMMHFVLNVGGVLAFIPLTGVPLLLISSGGSSSMAALISIGLAQNVIRKYKTGEKL